MCPRIQRGFAIVSAIFLLVVLAALGGFIATVATTQHLGSALDVQGAQVFYAARAGTEWGLQRALSAATCNATSSFAYGVGNIAVTVNCLLIVPDEAGASPLYTITATACTPGNAAAPVCPGDAANANYVERRLTVLADSTPP